MKKMMKKNQPKKSENNQKTFVENSLVNSSEVSLYISFLYYA